MDKNSIFKQLEKSGNLPTLPEVLLKLLVACDDENTPINEIAQIINRDPALSFRVLQLVNSAYYSFRHSFKNVEQAVVYLGTQTIKNIAITSSIYQVFEQNRQLKDSSFNTDLFWYHSLLCATLSKRISEETGTSDKNLAYLAALVHDIGKIILATTFPEDYKSASHNQLSDSEKLKEERDLVGIDHCQAGAWLVEKWHLNSLLVDAISYHHETLEQVAEAFPLVKVVYLANLLANDITQNNELLRAGELLFDLDEATIKRCIENSTDEVEQISSSLGIKFKNNIQKSNQPTSPQGKQSTEESERQRLVVEQVITSRVKNTSLLSSFQEELMRAPGVEEILSAFEKIMMILLELDKVLFFLPNEGETKLYTHTSQNSSFYQLSKSITFSVNQQTSLTIQAFTNNIQTTINKSQDTNSIADQQLLNLLQCNSALLIPVSVNKKTTGVVCAGLPNNKTVLNSEEKQLLSIIVHQVGLRLFIEQEQQRQAEIVHKERMATLSIMAKKLAHEINNPLGIIANYLVTIKMKLAEMSIPHEELDIVDEEIQRISTLLEQMDTFAQASFTDFQEVDINAELSKIIQLCKVSLSTAPELDILFMPDTELPTIITSRDAIKQIIINLLKNAAEAMNCAGRVMVHSKKLVESDTPEKPKGIEIIVTDSGPGLPEEIQKNLYQPFMTTKQNGHSGLGLSIVQKVVTDIGGRLHCSSRINEGTAFTIQLPVDLPIDSVIKGRENEL